MKELEKFLKTEMQFTQANYETATNRHRIPAPSYQVRDRPHQHEPAPKPALRAPPIPPLDIATAGVGAPPRRAVLHADRNRPADGADARASAAAGGRVEPVADERRAGGAERAAVPAGERDGGDGAEGEGQVGGEGGGVGAQGWREAEEVGGAGESDGED